MLLWRGCESFPFLFCYFHKMFSANIPQGRDVALFRMVKAETAFFHHPVRLCIAFIICAPDGCHFQFHEASLQQPVNGFRY